MQPLEGQRAVLTGAAGGIGSLLAARLRERGAVVTGVDRVASTHCDDNIVADLADPAGLCELCETLRQRPVDMLVNVAGVQYFGPYERQEPDSLRLGFAVNLVAPAALIHAVLPQMRSRGSGHIVNVGSILGSINYPHFAAYSSSKAGLRGLSDGLRRELAGLGIHVTHIAPRAVRTALNNQNVERFFHLSGMKADDPDKVARLVADAIVRRRTLLEIGFRERFLVRLNSLLPRLIDLGLSGQTAKARQLFPS